MKRIVTNLLIVFALSLGSLNGVAAQDLSAGRFLERVSARPVGDQVEQDQYLNVYMALNAATPAEVERVLSSVLQYATSDNSAQVRGYAVGFLLGIAIRPDGADLLASKSQEISSLLVDADPGIQRVAVAITDYVMPKAMTNKQPYVSALETAVQRTKTPQEVSVGMIGPLLFARSGDPSAIKPVLNFMHRDDLTADTRRELVHSLGTVAGLPGEVDQALSRELDDPDPTVRAAAVVVFADSTTAFHALAKDRVERMAKDPKEHPQIRELAKQALAGQTALNPNIDMPHDKPNPQ